MTLAADGLARLRSGRFDLAILDVGLPDGNGFELCRTLRGLSAIPVIFLTARSDEIDRVVGLEIGADDDVLKPFSPRELAARVKAMLRRRRASSIPAVAAALRFIEVDEERAIISCKGQTRESDASTKGEARAWRNVRTVSGVDQARPASGPPGSRATENTCGKQTSQETATTMINDGHRPCRGSLFSILPSHSWSSRRTWDRAGMLPRAASIEKRNSPNPGR